MPVPHKQSRKKPNHPLNFDAGRNGPLRVEHLEARWLLHSDLTVSELVASNFGSLTDF